MDCKEFRQLLDLYVDDELGPDASYSARQHVEACGSCRRAVTQVLLLRRTLKRVLGSWEPPKNLVSRVEKIAQPRWKRVTWRFFANWDLFWRGRVTVPIPLFLVLIGAVGFLSIWVFANTQKSEFGGPQSVSKRMFTTDQRQSNTFDLEQFDRGERAAIYKVLITDQSREGGNK